MERQMKKPERLLTPTLPAKELNVIYRRIQDERRNLFEGLSDDSTAGSQHLVNLTAGFVLLVSVIALALFY
jgi:hypothetical protein